MALSRRCLVIRGLRRALPICSIWWLPALLWQLSGWLAFIMKRRPFSAWIICFGSLWGLRSFRKWPPSLFQRPRRIANRCSSVPRDEFSMRLGTLAFRVWSSSGLPFSGDLPRFLSCCRWICRAKAFWTWSATGLFSPLSVWCLADISPPGLRTSLLKWGWFRYRFLAAVFAPCSFLL